MRYIYMRNTNITDNESIFNISAYNKFVNSLMLKDFLVYSNDELQAKFVGYITHVETLKNNPVSHIVNEFLSNELHVQRIQIIQLLIHQDNYKYQYLAYLLYDLLSNERFIVIILISILLFYL